MTDHPRGAVGAGLGGDAHSSPSSLRRVPAAADLLTVPHVEHLHVGNPIAHASQMAVISVFTKNWSLKTHLLGMQSFLKYEFLKGC